MRLLLLFLLAALSNVSMAQVCEPTSKEMERYRMQQTWTPRTLLIENGSTPVNGYVDQDSNFYFDDLSRKTRANVQLTIDPQNKGLEEFYLFCNQEKGHLLRALRRNRYNNKYALRVQYLPSLSGFKNQPLQTQGYKETSARLDLRFEDGSIVSHSDKADENFKTDAIERLNQQLAGQKEFGLLELDLTGLDDLVCDLVLGNASLSIFRSGYSKKPLVEQINQFKSTDVQSIYSALKEGLQAKQSKAKTLFTAGMIFANLAHDRRIDLAEPVLEFEVLKKLLDPSMRELSPQNDRSLSCVVDQLQKYKLANQNHYVNVRFTFPNMETLKKSRVGR